MKKPDVIAAIEFQFMTTLFNIRNYQTSYKFLTRHEDLFLQANHITVK